eukprot:5187590-Pleurochrysis_carterae.AAC.4
MLTSSRNMSFACACHQRRSTLRIARVDRHADRPRCMQRGLRGGARAPARAAPCSREAGSSCGRCCESRLRRGATGLDFELVCLRAYRGRAHTSAWLRSAGQDRSERQRCSWSPSDLVAAASSRPRGHSQRRASSSV